jgi:excisionase family DNA binding protein
LPSALNDEERLQLLSEGLATPREAWEFLRCSRATLYQLMGKELPYLKVGRSRRLPWKALRAYAARQIVGV